MLLHGDGQYAPEVLPSIVEPLELDKCDAVLGSRMMEPGGARRGGMPLYKFVGNKILTRLENAVVGMDLSEWHTGYRAYSLAALRDLPFDGNSDGFDFDTQIIVQLHEAGKRIVEVPIPTYYGDEISYVNGMQYAYDIVRHVLRYRVHKMGFGTGETAFASSAYEMKEGAATSHGRLLAWMAARQPARVLDLGCSDGKLAEALQSARPPGHRRRPDRAARRRGAGGPLRRRRPRRRHPRRGRRRLRRGARGRRARARARARAAPCPGARPCSRPEGR